MKREKAVEIVKELPGEFKLELLFERLVFIEKVDKGLQALSKGKTISNEKS